jgi:hypothetical protein
MKKITVDMLINYGFELSEVKKKNVIKTYSKDNFVISVEQDGSFYYVNMGFEYPLKDEEDLKRIYFEARREKLQL